MIITVANGKGGVGKSALAAELVSYLAARNEAVIALDADRNGTLTRRCGIARDAEVEAVTADVLTGEATLEEAALPSPTIPGATVLAGTHDLNAVNLPVADVAEKMRQAATNGRHVVIDTRPALELLTEAALSIADVIVVSTDCSEEAREQIEEIETFLSVRLGRQIDVIVPSRFNTRTALDAEEVEAMGERWPGKVTAPIHEAVAVRDAYVDGKPLSRYQRWHPVAAQYAAACATITHK